MTKKNRKARKLQEMFPEVNIRVLYQRDYLHLLVKYGLEAPSQLSERFVDSGALHFLPEARSSDPPSRAASA